MTKGLDSKILYSLLIVSGFVLTIGAASAVVMYSDNIELDNGTGDSSIKVTSSTGDSKVLVDGQRTFALKTPNDKPRFQITDETMGKPRITINKYGQVGIETIYPQAKLDVAGTMHVRKDANFLQNVNIDGSITGSFIQGILATIAANEATIAALEVRIAALEASLAINEPMILSNEVSISSNVGMITTHDTMILANEATLATHDTMILANEADIATNAQAIAEGGGGPNPCDPDGDGAITPEEIDQVYADNGFPSVTLTSINQWLGQAEQLTPSSNNNGVLDSVEEVAQWNIDRFIPAGIAACVYP